MVDFVRRTEISPIGRAKQRSVLGGENVRRAEFTPAPTDIHPVNAWERLYAPASDGCAQRAKSRVGVGRIKAPGFHAAEDFPFARRAFETRVCLGQSPYRS